MEYLENAILSVNKKLSSIESKLLLTDLYNGVYGDIKDPNSLVETVFSTTLYRESESTQNYTDYGSYLKEYIIYDFKGIYNISVLEYLNLTLYEKDVMIEIAKEEINKREEIAAEAKRKLEDARQNINNNQRLKDVL